jgi:hypothetical protein
VTFLTGTENTTAPNALGMIGAVTADNINYCGVFEEVGSQALTFS